VTPERLLTARDLAELLGFKPGTVLDMWERRELPGFKLPNGAVRFRWSEVDSWLEAKRAGAGGEAPATPQRPPELVSLTPATPK
jgi:excisionase family DNA binding protein